ncbi:DUF1707 SHOCT-like domain-containing protein [Nocardia bovistercoris]|uniref:DUF1707 domain-containing protein n=1 Tax=Nocardia bovistercoris TaxID=2785916 RepID=A0A931IBM0_9NOCA|nr:DUF1707 domain-containing protein [Nocardia bovistercoris]MBH0778617.1 DUF1707 domain-containing protein [Nocardia bovistercoris]
MAADTARLRARDSDRADVCGLLDAALADGQLSASEHTARTKSAMTAASFADLDRLVGDLQIPGDMVDAPVVRGVPRRARRWWIPAAAVLVAAVLGTASGCVASAVDEATGPPTPDLTTGSGLAYFIANYRAEYGDTVTDDLTVYPGYAVFHRSPGNPVRSQYYHFDGDFSTFGSESSRKPSTPTLDFGTVDLPRLAGLLAGAVRSLKIANGQINHVNFEFPPGSDKDPKPYVRIYVRNEAEDSGFMTVAFDGEVLDVRPPNG